MELVKTFEKINRYYENGKQSEEYSSIDYDITKNGETIGVAHISSEGVEIRLYNNGMTMLDKQLLLDKLFNK